jgi:hypothetical protein
MSGRPGVPGPGSERAAGPRSAVQGREALAAFETGPNGIHSHWFCLAPPCVRGPECHRGDAWSCSRRKQGFAQSHRARRPARAWRS